MNKISKQELRTIRLLLRDKSTRDKEGVFIAEGIKIVKDILSKDHAIRKVLISSKVLTSPAAKKVTELAENCKVDISRVPAAEFEKLSSLRNSQGILAVVEKPATEEKIAGDRLVLCDGVQDPGNLGALIRSAVAFGVDAILLTGETADMFNPKVVRASSGTMLEIPVFKVFSGDIDGLKGHGYKVLGGSIDPEGGSEDISKVKDVGGPLIVCFGSEGKGLSKEILEKVDVFYNIPIDQKIESLNVTAAAAITLYVLRGKQ
ncbi:MAG: RNA methyltransferase [Candidatus Tantalella remota]|nr:RNA methyltransferase [Candidatus Tantalella remota]